MGMGLLPSRRRDVSCFAGTCSGTITATNRSGKGTRRWAQLLERSPPSPPPPHPPLPSVRPGKATAGELPASQL